ncbi:MAG: DUF115 domain-containing protein [Candidatus Adiutrix sp.]|jgi:hypothetical protein|nr:DUF115 domain-containing protein [Candidatus Adiutrix sp.]
MNMETAAPDPNQTAGFPEAVLKLVGGPQGPGLIYKDRTLHQVDDPWTEAAGWLARGTRHFPNQAPGLALVFGLGLGYHLKLLRRDHPGLRLMVYEPSPDIKEFWSLKPGLGPEDGEAPFIFSTPEEFKTAVSREVVYGPARGLMVVIAESYQEMDPESCQAFSEYIHQEVIRRAVIDRTRANTGPAFMENLALNSGRLLTLPDLMLLKGRLPARAAFLVGSGPSLDQNAACLREVGPRGLILAAASAVKPLLAHGVSPDVIVVLESEDTSSYLRLSEEEKALLSPGTVLALASGCHPANFELTGFHQAVFHASPGEALVFSRGAFLPQGGNAGTAAFALAYCWGLGPLVLVAQDQAYAGGGRLHAEGTPGEVVDQDKAPLIVPGVDGGRVATNTGLLASLNWYAEAARTVKAKASPPELLNASAGGARIEGFQEVDLGAVVAGLPPVSGPLDLAAVLPKLPLSSKKEVEEDLRQLAGVVSTLRRLAHLDYKKAYAEVQAVGQISKFLERVLAEAQVANTQRELLSAMDRAERTMSTMILSL